MAQAREQVGGHGFVHALRWRQVQGLHDGHKLRLGFARHAGIAGLLSAHAGVAAPLVIVARPHGGLGRQLEQDLRQAVVHRLRAARLKVGAPAAIDQQGVAGKNVFAPQVAHAACGVAGRVQGCELLGAKRHRVTVLQLPACRTNAAGGRHGRFGPGVLDQLPGAGDVVGVGVGFKRPNQLKSMRLQHGQVALNLRVHRVDDHGFFARGVDQHIGVRAGGWVKQLNGQHVDSWGMAAQCAWRRHQKNDPKQRRYKRAAGSGGVGAAQPGGRGLTLVWAFARVLFAACV